MERWKGSNGSCKQVRSDSYVTVGAHLTMFIKATIIPDSNRKVHNQY